MATASVPGPQGVKRREMQEVKAPEQFQFNKQGQMLAGVLFSIEPAEVKGKQAMEYMLIMPSGDRLTFLGTADLNKKIQPSHIGHYVEIRYERDDDSFQKQGQNPMKVFKVAASKDVEPGFKDPAA